MFHRAKFPLREAEKVLAGHIKVPGGPHVARGPDVAQTCFKLSCDTKNLKYHRKELFYFCTISLFYVITDDMDPRIFHVRMKETLHFDSIQKNHY